MPDSTHFHEPPAAEATTCLGRTCLKWGADGELTALDLSLVMERLAQVDREVSALYKQVVEGHGSAVEQQPARAAGCWPSSHP
jgi:hypothetical protein